MRDLVFGLIDCSVVMLFFIPLFGQQGGEIIRQVSLLSLQETPLFIKVAYFAIILLTVACGIATLGLVQLIKRKSLFRVDSSILVLGGFYVLVFLAYLFFEFFVVNYRPVLIEGVLEASYPSSTTMLMMCIMPTAIMQFHHLISSKRLRNIVNAFCGIYASFMVIGRVLSGVHWFTDIVGGILLSATLVMLYYSTNQLVNSKASRSSQRSR